MSADLITVTAYGRRAGSARVRVFDWLDHLHLRADSETYLGTASLSPGTLAAHAPDVLAAERRLRSLPQRLGDATLLLSRRASPFGRGRLEERLLTAARHSVYDFDDALMLRPDDVQGRILAPHRQWRRAVRAADTVMAGNDRLAERAAEHARDVVVIPSCVEPGRYVQRPVAPREDAPRAVWLGSPSTESYLRRIEQPLLEAHRQAGLRLTVISAGDRHLGAIDAMVDRVRWTLEGFAPALAQADFGIMPLDDSDWSRGKCAYKLLQYGAAGLPMVADPIGANAQVLRRSGGLAPADAGEWTDALLALATMPTDRAAALGRQSRDAIEAHYSFDAWRARWCAATGVRDQRQRPAAESAPA
jgi:glycosyltransferase involved in cell wall biosynthesis